MTAISKGGRGTLPVLLILAALSLLMVPALAHRQPEVIGTVVHEMEDGQPVTKVTWELHAHDALQFLETIPEVTDLTLDTEENLIEAAAYVASWVDYGEAEPVTLGAEVDGNFLFVYQYLPGHVEVKRAAILSDIAPNWSNLVNVQEQGETVSSRTFTAEYPQGATLETVRN